MPHADPHPLPEAYRRSQRIDRRIVHHLLAWCLLLFFRIYGRLRIIGREHIPPTGPVIFACNHVSLIDPPLGWAAVYGRRRMWGIARESLWKHPLLAYLLDSMGAIPVKRYTADRNALRQAIEILQMGETIGMFPEGTRSPDGRLLPAQPGIALMVQRSRAPVVPVTVIGPYEMLPRHRKWPRRVPLTIIFGPPICFGPEATREQICARVMEAMATQMTAHGYPMEPPSPERATLAPQEND